ncbi:sulfite exporter TauE/SafE family protein [Paracidovorax citrulli]
MTEAVLLSVFLLALLGGAHCAAMCGGVAMAVTPGPQAFAGTAPAASIVRWGTPRQWLSQTLAMHAGRLTAYAIAGAVLGGLGAGAWQANYLPVQRLLFAAGSAMLALSGLAVLSGRPLLSSALERVAGPVAARFLATPLRWLAASGAPATSQARGSAAGVRHTLVRRYTGGLLWGMVPCGMVYSALSLALLAGSAASGALVMLAFGLGTLPNLMVISGLAGQLRAWSRRRPVRIAVGALILAFGAAGLVRAALLPETIAAQGFCLAW